MSGGSSDKPSVAKVVSWLKVVKRLGGSSKPKTSRSEYSSPEIGAASRLAAEPAAPAQHQQHLAVSLRSREESSSPSRSNRSSSGQATGEAATTSGVELRELENESVGRKSESSQRSQPDRTGGGPVSPTFFQFEFELGAEIPRSDSFDTPVTTPSPSDSATAAAAAAGTLTPGKASAAAADNSTATTTTGKANLEPRVSTRFSKRASLLPPAALDMLKDNSGSEDEGSPVPDVPSVPLQYVQQQQQQRQAQEDSAARKKRRKREKEEREAQAMAYAKPKHAYAVKALAEYEQSLEEEFEWKEKLVEEHHLQLAANGSANGNPNHQPPEIDHFVNVLLPDADSPNRPADAKAFDAALVDAIVPRLAVSWPLSFSEDE